MKTLLIYPMFCLVAIGLLACQSIEPESAVKEVAQGETFNANEPPRVPPDNHHGTLSTQPPPLVKVNVE